MFWGGDGESPAGEEAVGRGQACHGVSCPWVRLLLLCQHQAATCSLPSACCGF